MKRTRTAPREWRNAPPNAWLIIRLKPTAGDFFLLTFLIFLSFLQFFFFPLPASTSKKAVVYLNGQRLKVINLNHPHLETITYQGKKLMELQVANSGVRVISSTCPDKLCQRQGAIFREGDVLICLPNKIVIKTSGSDDLDAVIR